MDLEALRVADLLRVARVFEHRGFTAAARSLGESTKQVSRGVARVEEALGATLFHRSTRQVVPTDEGEATYPHLRRVLDTLDHVADTLGPGDALDGRLRIQVMTLFADAAMAWVDGMLRESPRLEVDLLVRDRVEDMVGEGLDVALMAERPADGAVIVRRLGRASAPLGAHTAYVSRHGLPSGPEDLVHHACLRFGERDRQDTWPLVDPDGHLHAAPVGGRLLCNDSRLLQRGLQLGMGIGPVLEQTADVVPVLPGWRFGPLELHLAIAPGRRHLARVRLAVEGLTRVVEPWLS